MESQPLDDNMVVAVAVAAPEAVPLTAVTLSYGLHQSYSSCCFGLAASGRRR